MLGFSYHSIILLIGIAVAGLSLVGAIGVGPYGRRGVRLMLVAISFAAFLGSAFWFTVYLGFIEQRRSIETRLSELRGQALGTGSLACLERAGGIVEAACAQAIFAGPETLAAANLYTAARLDLLAAATRYAGPRTPQFDEAVDSLTASLQQDPFGLTANVLMLRKGCTAERCEDIAIFRDPAQLWSNIRQKSFDANVARHSAGWRTPGTAALPAAATPGLIAPTGSETRAPIPEKYTLPSAASIPPVSIMTDEPARGADPAPPPVKERPSSPRQPAGATARDEQTPGPAPATTSSTPERPAPARREKQRPNAPLAISPQ